MSAPEAPAAAAAHDAIVFDLDGTLWDTCEACAIGWNRVLAQHAIAFRTITSDDVRGVAGQPHDLCIRQVFAGLPEAQLELLIADTQEEDNRAIAEFGGTLYPGLQLGLERLAKQFGLYIVSNCQAGYIEIFLDSSRLRRLFVDFECWGNTGASKAENLRRVI